MIPGIFRKVKFISGENLKCLYKSPIQIFLIITVAIILIEVGIDQAIPDYINLNALIRGALLLILLTPLLLIFIFHPMDRYMSERKKYERNLEESNEKYQSLLHEMREGMALMEMIFDHTDRVINFRFVETNKEFENQTGLHGVEGKFISEVVPDFKHSWLEVFGRIAKTQISEHFEDELEALSRFFEVYAYPLGKAGSNLVAVIFNDITERREAERILKKKEKNHRKIFSIIKHSREAIISVDMEGKISTWNSGAENLYGYMLEEIKGQDISILTPDGIKSDWEEVKARVLKGEVIKNFEVLHKNKEGKTFQVSVTVSPVMDEKNNIIGISKIAHDITERKLAEEALQESERRWITTLSSISEGVIAADNEGIITFINIEAEKLTGWSRQEVLHHPVKDVYRIFDEQTGVEIKNTIRDIITNTKTADHKVLMRKDGSRIPFEENGAPIVTEDGKILGVILVFHDITERKNAENWLKNYNTDLQKMVEERTAELETALEKAESADKMKTSFLLTMSHELRTPLNSIIGFSGILLKELAGPLEEEQKKQLNMIQVSGRHLLRLVNDILDMSKIEVGELVLNFERFDLIKVIEEIIATEKSFSDEKGLDILLNKYAEELFIQSDPYRIHQILLNLVHNSLKFTEKGFVHIQCEATQDYVIVKISDTGIGIAEENIDKLFTSFVQFDNDLVRRNQWAGSGLGLAISKRLLEMLNGSISVESKYGEGSTFTVMLPKTQYSNSIRELEKPEFRR